MSHCKSETRWSVDLRVPSSPLGPKVVPHTPQLRELMALLIFQVCSENELVEYRQQEHLKLWNCRRDVEEMIEEL